MNLISDYQGLFNVKVVLLKRVWIFIWSRYVQSKCDL